MLRRGQGHVLGPPSVSPDGRYVAVRDFEYGKSSAVLLLPIAGGDPRELFRASAPQSLNWLLAWHGNYAAIHALNAIDALGPKALPWKAQILTLPTVDPASPERVRTEYAAKLVKRIGESL